MAKSVSENRARMPQGTQSFLDRRTLDSDFGVLSRILKPGQDVLDVGCGSGVITMDIAQRTFPGTVVGIDISSHLLQSAQTLLSENHLPNLAFALDDIIDTKLQRRFDVVASARMLQWLSNPLVAIQNMKKLLASGGFLVLLDYNHLKVKWEPEPPNSFLKFYAKFLEWRDSAGMDNEIGDNLEKLMNAVNLKQVHTSFELEKTSRGDFDFESRIRLWYDVIQSRGHQLVADGFLSESERALASEEYLEYIKNKSQTQILYLIGAVGHGEI